MQSYKIIQNKLKMSALFAKMNYALDLKERYLIWIIVRIDG